MIPSPSTTSGITVYKYALHPSLLAMARYGILGGGLTGFALHLPAHMILRALLDTPLVLRRLETAFLVYAALLFALGLGLLGTLAVWQRRQLPTGLRPITVGLLISLFYTLTASLVITSGVLTVLALREFIPSVYEVYGFSLGVPITEDPLRQPSLVPLYVTLFHTVVWAWIGGLLLIGWGGVVGRWLLPVTNPAVLQTPVRETTLGYTLLLSYILSMLLFTGVYLASPRDSFQFIEFSPFLFVTIVLQIAFIIHVWRLKTPHSMMLTDVTGLSLVWASGLILAGFSLVTAVPHETRIFPGEMVLMIVGCMMISFILALLIVWLGFRARRRTRENRHQVRILIPSHQLRWSGVIAAFVNVSLLLMSLPIAPFLVTIFAYSESPFSNMSLTVPNMLSAYLDLWLFYGLHRLSLWNVGLSLVLSLLTSLYAILRATGLMRGEQKGANQCSHCKQVSHLGEVFCPYCGIPFSAPDSPPETPSQILVRRRQGRLHRWLLASAAFVIGWGFTSFLLIIVWAPQMSPSRETLSSQFGIPTATPILLQEVLSVAQDVPAGMMLSSTSVTYTVQPVEEISRDNSFFGLTPVPAPLGAEDVIGQRARRDLYQGEYIVPSMLQSGNSYDLSGTPAHLVMPGAISRRFPLNSYLPPAEGTLNQTIWWEEWGVVIEKESEVLFEVERIAGNLQPTLLIWSDRAESWVGGDYHVDPTTGRVTRRVSIQVGTYIAVVTHGGSGAGRYRLSIDLN